MKMDATTLIFLVVFWSFIGELHSWQLSISHPVHVIMGYNDTKTVLCKADPGVKLTGCEFGFENNGWTSYYNASSGSLTGEGVEFEGFTVNYHRLALHRGECSIELTRKNITPDDVIWLSCRARTEHSGWKYNFTHIADPAERPDRIKLHTVPGLPFLLPGSNLTVRCDTTDGNSVDRCTLDLPKQVGFPIYETSDPIPPHNVTYVGEGWAKGQCRYFIPNVDSISTSRLNTIWCFTWRDGEESYRRIHVVVAAAPVEGPTLSITSVEFWPRISMTLKCVAPASRPPASIAWYLGDQPVSADLISEELVDTWRWDMERETTTQSVTLNLTEGDQGKNVTCVMSHVALTANKTSTLPIG